MPDPEKEREHLAKADLVIANAKTRITEQINLIRRLSDAGHDTARAETMLQQMEKLLEQMHRHRRAIPDAIAREQ